MATGGSRDVRIANEGAMVESRKSLPVTVAMACWLDLRGYGAMLNRASFDPFSPLAKQAIDRLRAFQDVAASKSLVGFPTLVINDGAIAYADVGIDARDKPQQIVVMMRQRIRPGHDMGVFHPGARAAADTLVAAFRSQVRDDRRGYARPIPRMLGPRLL